MKKITLLLFVSLLTFASCGKDDEDDGNTEQNESRILGVWAWTASSENGQNIPLDACDLMDTFEFTEDDVVDSYFYQETSNGPCINEIEFATYSIDGDDITFNYEAFDESYTVIIESLNSTTLILRDEDDGDVYRETYTRQ